MAPWNRRGAAFAARASAIEPGHFGRCAGFVDKHQIVGPPFALLRPPLLASFRDVDTVEGMPPSGSSALITTPIPAPTVSVESRNDAP
jgi:hypothetical protein